uniref:Uncharacterized protein n=1 Tax=Lactuca sativa TaxID=4236 RepID=A0A9R1VN73_LACSA|nr:hypothetical protein LSAT_V11C500271040 [Lactuca sativa]
MSTSTLTSSIPITSIYPLPQTSFVETSLPEVSIPISSPIFTESTVPTTSSVSTPLGVPIIKSVSEEIQTSGILGNTSEVGPNASICPSSSIPPFDDDTGILFGDDQEPIFDFVFQPFTVNFKSDVVDALMTKGQFKELNEKHDSILEYSHALSSIKWENLLITHRATVEMVTSSNVKVLEKSTKGVLGSESSSKQGGEKEKNLKKVIDQKDNKASGSRKYKGKVVFEEDSEENSAMTELEKEARERRDKEVDELNALRQKLDAEEANIKHDS